MSSLALDGLGYGVGRVGMHGRAVNEQFPINIAFDGCLNRFRDSLIIANTSENDVGSRHGVFDAF